METKVLCSTNQPHALLFANHKFMLLWMAQTLTQIVQNLMGLALVTLSFQLSNGSAFITSATVAAFLLPGVIFSAISAAFVDRVSKRLILVYSSLLRAIVIPLLIGVSFLDQAIALPLVLLFTVLFSTLGQFFGPAEGALIPALVDNENLVKANSCFQITFFGAQFIGFSLLGPILPAIIGLQNLFWLCSLIFLVATILLWSLPTTSRKTRFQVAQLKQMVTLLAETKKEISEGWDFIRQRPLIWFSIVRLSMVQVLLFTLTGIGLSFISDKDAGLGLSADKLVFILVPLSIGIGLGLLLVNLIVSNTTRPLIMFLATIGISVTLFGMGFLKPMLNLFSSPAEYGEATPLTILVILSLLFGLFISMINVPALTILQENAPKQLVGRVYAAYYTLSNFVTLFPLLFAGSVADSLGVVPIFFLLGASVLFIGLNSHFKELPQDSRSVVQK